MSDLSRWPSAPILTPNVSARIAEIERDRPGGTILIPVRVGDISYLFYKDGRPTGVTHDWSDDDGGEIADTAYVHWQWPLIVSMRDLTQGPTRAREASESGARDFSSEMDALRSAKAQGATHADRAPEGVFVYFPVVAGYSYKECALWPEGGKWHVQSPAGRPRTTLPQTAHLIEHFITVDGSMMNPRAAREDAPAVYEEEAAAPRAHKKHFGPLRWKRAAPGHYKAQGIRGPYEIQRIKPNRRQSILPWKMSGPGGTVRTFDSSDEAKTFAQALDTILSDPTLCAPQPKPPAALPRVLPPPPRATPPTQLRPPPPRGPAGKQRAWRGYADEKKRKKSAAEEAGEAIPFEHISRDLAEVELGKTYGQINSARDVYDLLAEDLGKTSQEVFVVLPLNLHNELLCRPVEVARGQRDRVAVDTSDILRPVITKNATSFYVCHQHPSTHANKPSKADISLTNDIIKATKAAIPEVEFLDHVIVGPGSPGNGMYYSFANKKAYRV